MRAAWWGMVAPPTNMKSVARYIRNCGDCGRCIRFCGNGLGGTPSVKSIPTSVGSITSRRTSHETDMLLQPTPTAAGAFLANDARVVITVDLKPFRPLYTNLHFV